MNDKKFIQTNIKKSLRKLYGKKNLKKQELHRLNILSNIVSSILLKQDCRVPQIAAGINADRRKQESVEKQVHRFLENKHITHGNHYLPYISSVLQSIGKNEDLTLIIDGSTVGSGNMVLMFSVLYNKRAIPLIWSVKRKKKGHFKEIEHLALLEAVSEFVPDGVKVTVLGDGEYDGTEWQEKIKEKGWDYVLRVSKNLLLEDEEGECFKPCEVFVKPGEGIFLEDLRIGKKRYGKVNILVWYEKGHEEPLYLVTNKDDLGLIAPFYIKRFYIVPIAIGIFRDMKSMGYNINRSRMRSPKKLYRLIICCCLAYILTIISGIKCSKSAFYSIVKTGKKEALSLFQLVPIAIGIDLLVNLLTYVSGELLIGNMILEIALKKVSSFERKSNNWNWTWAMV